MSDFIGITELEGNCAVSKWVIDREVEKKNSDGYLANFSTCGDQDV